MMVHSVASSAPLVLLIIISRFFWQHQFSLSLSLSSQHPYISSFDTETSHKKEWKTRIEKRKDDEEKSQVLLSSDFLSHSLHIMSSPHHFNIWCHHYYMIFRSFHFWNSSLSLFFLVITRVGQKVIRSSSTAASSHTSNQISQDILLSHPEKSRRIRGELSSSFFIVFAAVRITKVKKKKETGSNSRRSTREKKIVGS